MSVENMKTIKNLSKERLTQMVRHYLPNTNVGDIHVWDGKITEEQLRHIFEDVRMGEYIEDAISLMDNPALRRQSVSYLVTWVGNKDDIKFEVVDTQKKGPSPHGYLGHVFTYDKEGNEVRQVTLENLSLISK